MVGVVFGHLTNWAVSFSNAFPNISFGQKAVSSSSVDVEEICFDFRKQRFIYSKENENFCKLPYPTKETFGYYLKCTGHTSEAKIVAASEKWGRNV